MRVPGVEPIAPRSADDLERRRRLRCARARARAPVQRELRGIRGRRRAGGHRRRPARLTFRPIQERSRRAHDTQGSTFGAAAGPVAATPGGRRALRGRRSAAAAESRSRRGRTVSRREPEPRCGARSRSSAGAPASRATSAAAACDAASGVTCSDVVVPLDRTGRVPGHDHAARRVASRRGRRARRHDARRRRPGSGIRHRVQPQRQGQRGALSRALPGLPDRRVRQPRHGQVGPPRLLGAAAVDDVRRRRTPSPPAAPPRSARARDFYSTHDHADDTEAVRVALGVDKIALWGTSYGTKLALAYALALPDARRAAAARLRPADGVPRAVRGERPARHAARAVGLLRRRRMPCRNPELRGRRGRGGKRSRRQAGPRPRAARERVDRGTSAWTASTCSRWSSTPI